MTDADSDAAIESFIRRWSPSGGSERANYQSFLIELCGLLGVDPPEPSVDDPTQDAYVFEKAIIFDNRDGSSSTKRADLYRRGCFVCETKQGVEADEEKSTALSAAERERRAKRRSGHGKRGSKVYDDTLRKAHGQAEAYARHLPASEGRPPFLLVVDVGHSIELYSEFSRTGGAYVPFPDPLSHRIKLDQLADPKIRERLALVWTDPLALDPARRSAKVTREIAASLAKLAKSLEGAGHHAEDVAHFLMRCLFTMFAEDVGLLPKNCFKEMLTSLDDPEHFTGVVEDLWRTMNTGGFNAQLRKKLLWFNGGLFDDPSAIAINRDQLDLLIEAAKADWQDVEPAIFGTLLERALDPVERHKLGAHYTPRAYVERLVVPTVVEPLRAEWDAARAAAVTLATGGETKKAIAEIEKFHDRLCEVRVLDPACGSGNFLYVVLEHLKRLEGEVFATYSEIAERQMLLESGHTVDPHQLLGIEINPRAAAIAELVLWIGYLQWHFRTRGSVAPPEPVIKNFKNIECRDAVLSYTSKEVVLDDEGRPVTIWDGRTTKPHPVTGLEVPDETARVPMYRYLNPKKAEWPEADFVVGNPPFIGAARMRSVLGDGYVEALRQANAIVPDSCDFVMYWWNKAATLLAENHIRQFGLITTNSVKQSFNRRVLQRFMDDNEDPIRIAYAVPDHPWVDSSDGAAVRISMTVARRGRGDGELQTVSGAAPDVLNYSSIHGPIASSLTTGSDLGRASILKANQLLAIRGVCLVGKGFIVTPERAHELGHKANNELAKRIRPYLNGKDVTHRARGVYAIDMEGLEIEDVREKFPAVYQWLIERVKPERDQNREEYRRLNWWKFGRRHTELRSALQNLERHIATPMTAKHRMFVFLSGETLPDQGLVSVAVDDAFILGVLSGRFHVVWSLASGGTLESRPRYNQTKCFDPFPFPAPTDSQKSRIRELGEQLDAHRKRQQAQHAGLTMTGMYNVLEKLRSGDTLTTKEKQIHEWGLVSVLKQIHDDLDAAVADAYGWPVDLTDEEILERLVALNHERAAEEARGIVRWLRPEFQNPDGKTQQSIDVGDTKTPAKATTTKIKKQKWPTALAEQAAAVQSALATIGTPASETDVAKRFTRASKDRISELLETLESLGRARQLDDGRYVAA